MRSRDKISLVAGGVALALAVLLVGGAPRWAMAAIALPLAVALAATVTSRRKLAEVSPLMVVLGLALGLTLLQLLPLPRSIVAALNPHGVELRETGLDLIGQTAGAWQPISLDTAGTLHGAAMIILMLGVAFIALRLTAADKGRFWICGAIAVLAGTVALLTGAHVALGAQTLYGWYRPTEASPALFGPLLNPNHLGGLMAMGSLLSAGLFFHDAQASLRRVGWAALTLLCIATTMLSQSRGAVLSLGLGAVAFAIAMLGQRVGAGPKRRNPPGEMWRTKVPMAVFATCLVALVIYSSAEKVSGQIIDTQVTELGDRHSKFAAWRSSMTLVAETPWVGIGRGALEPVFTRVHGASSYHTFSHLENEYVQAVVEWGVVGAVVIGVFMMWLVLSMVRRWHRGPLAASALGALLAVATQNAVDFSLSLPALALCSVALAATLAYVPVEDIAKNRGRGANTSDHANGPGIRRMFWRGILVVAVLGAGIVMLLPSSRSVAESHDLLTARNADMGIVRDAISAHPLDYLAYGRATDILLAQNDARAGGFLRHALRLHPTHSGLHRIAARLLIRGGHADQAALEYRLALQNTQAPRRLLDEVSIRLIDPNLAVRAIPLDMANPEQVVKFLISDGHLPVALRWLEAVLEKNPESAVVTQLLLAVAQKSGDSGIAERAARLTYRAKGTYANLFTLATILNNRGAFAEVATVLEIIPTIEARADERARGWMMRCDALIALTHVDEARRCLRELALAGILSSAQIQNVTQKLAVLDHTAGSLVPPP